MSHNQPYKERMKIAGDWAEKAFEDFADQKQVAYQRYGFDRSSLTSFHDLPLFVRKTPDYVCIKGGKSFLVEAKGCGRGSKVNIKTGDIQGMMMWNYILPLYIFVNDSDTDKIAMVHIEKLADSLTNTGLYTTEKWSDGVEHLAIDKKVFQWMDKS